MFAYMKIVVQKQLYLTNKTKQYDMIYNNQRKEKKTMIWKKINFHYAKTHSCTIRQAKGFQNIKINYVQQMLLPSTTEK